MNKIEIKTIDATGKVLGRLASQIAIILRGKDKVDFQPHILTTNRVVVENVRRLKITGRKLEQKEYLKHSYHPGGLKRTKMDKVFQDNSAEVLRLAVLRMLPKNKSRKKIIKKLIIK
ncbi:MAG: 50S ribosomal protein L13 [bacterium]